MLWADFIINCLHAYCPQGSALFLLERYLEAREAFLEGLALDPNSKALQVCMNGVCINVCGMCVWHVLGAGAARGALALDPNSKGLRVRATCVLTCAARVSLPANCAPGLVEVPAQLGDSPAAAGVAACVLTLPTNYAPGRPEGGPGAAGGLPCRRRHPRRRRHPGQPRNHLYRRRRRQHLRQAAALAGCLRRPCRAGRVGLLPVRQAAVRARHHALRTHLLQVGNGIPLWWLTCGGGGVARGGRCGLQLLRLWVEALPAILAPRQAVCRAARGAAWHAFHARTHRELAYREAAYRVSRTMYHPHPTSIIRHTLATHAWRGRDGRRHGTWHTQRKAII